MILLRELSGLRDVVKYHGFCGDPFLGEAGFNSIRGFSN